MRSATAEGVRLTRRTALAFLFTSACTTRDPARALIRACRYLWSQQAEDGGWHSRTYGLLKSGQSLTGFVLNALLQVRRQTCQPPAGGLDRALAFLKRNTNAEGAVGKMDPLLYDYPSYATALAVQALRRAGRSADRQAAWLRPHQFSRGHGCTPGHPPSPPCALVRPPPFPPNSP